METNLKSIRKSRGMTQRQLAESIGEKVATYGTWERGTSTPNIEQLVRCAQVLDCSTDEILGMEIKTTFADQREAELHRIWRGLDRERQDRLIDDARDMEAAKSAGSVSPEKNGRSA